MYLVFIVEHVNTNILSCTGQNKGIILRLSRDYALLYKQGLLPHMPGGG